MNLKVIWLEFPILISYLFQPFELLGRLSLEFKRISEMTNLGEMHKEIEILGNELEFQ